MNRPAAFLALWNGIGAAAWQREYETWHAFEHVPERVGLPGFLAAQRYASPAAGARGPAYFTLYALESLAALDHGRYRQVFAEPTPWTARMRGRLTDFLRLPCSVGGVHGIGSASRLAVLHLRARRDDAGAQLDAALAACVQRAQAVRAQWGTYRATSAIPIANRADAGCAPQPGRDLVALLQGLDAAALQAQAEALVRALAPVAAAVREPQAFELQSEVRREDLLHPLAGRQPARTELQDPVVPGDPA